ncbi:hypothetical protein KEM55_003454, partial [Ascosphaera atra]
KVNAATPNLPDMFTFTPLLGAHHAQSKAQQSLLEFDGGVKVLVDVGWDGSFDTDALKELEKYGSELSLVILCLRSC